MTKDGVRDFIAAEYTLSENYVHGLAAFAPRLKNFESPHSSRGSSPELPAGNTVSASFRRNLCEAAKRTGGRLISQISPASEMPKKPRISGKNLICACVLSKN